MGPASDRTAVVGSNLMVHGTVNLRVMDASIFPSPIGGNTAAPSMMVADKGAEIIIAAYQDVHEDL